MLRRDFLSSLALSAAPARRPPNFVFILIDDYGWKDTGYNGSTLLRNAEHRPARRVPA
jgi:arylsulfatase A-like enzyme